MKTIQLSRGKISFVDDDDFEWLSQWTWHCSDIGYARRNSKTDNSKVRPYMHRLILHAEPGMIVDHINFDRLDNQKNNLRICSISENVWHSGKYNTNSSGYKGVSYSKKDKVWRARIYLNSHEIYLGCFRTPEDAANAYDKAALELYREFAWLNFPGGVR